MKGYLAVFEKEKRLLDEVKCLLLKNEDLSDVLIDARRTDKGYRILSDGIVYEITVEDKMIVRCEISYS